MIKWPWLHHFVAVAAQLFSVQPCHAWLQDVSRHLVLWRFVILTNLFSVSLFADDIEPEKQPASWSSWRTPDHHQNRLYCIISATALFIKYRLSGSYRQYCFRSFPSSLVFLDQVRGEPWIRQPTVHDVNVVHVVSNFIYLYIYL